MVSPLLSHIIIIILPFWNVIPVVNLQCWNTIAGLYEQSTKIIYICENKNENRAQKDFIKNHEIGHYFWFNYMNPSQRDEYKIAYQKSMKLWITAFYREYSMSNELEDFADNYALIHMKGSNILPIKKRIMLIKKYIDFNSWLYN